MSARDRARQLHDETELLRVLVATLMTEIDTLVPDAPDGRRTRVDVLARMITATAADVATGLDHLGSYEDTSPAEMANVVQFPREATPHRLTHPVFAGPAGRGRVAHRT